MYKYTSGLALFSKKVRTNNFWAITIPEMYGRLRKRRNVSELHNHRQFHPFMTSLLLHFVS